MELRSFISRAACSVTRVRKVCTVPVVGSVGRTSLSSSLLGSRELETFPRAARCRCSSPRTVACASNASVGTKLCRSKISSCMSRFISKSGMLIWFLRQQEWLDMSAGRVVRFDNHVCSENTSSCCGWTSLRFFSVLTFSHHDSCWQTQLSRFLQNFTRGAF